MSVRCLIVDDNDRFLDAARNALESDGVAVVGVAVDGTGAVERIRELRPDVVVVDICLGPESGLVLTERIAGPDAPYGTKVILVSTYAASDFDDLLSASSALAFLPKTELSGAAVRRLLGSGPGD